VNRNETMQIERAFRQAFGCPPGPLDQGLALRRRGKEIWLCPKELGSLGVSGLRRSGVHVADVQAFNRPYAATFEWALSFGHLLSAADGGRGVAMLDPEAARAFCMGEDVEPEWGESVALASDGAQVVARCGDHILGLGRWDGGMLHNDTPRHWRCEHIVL